MTLWPWDEDSLRRPKVSIALGTRLLSSLRSTFSANPALAIAAYNGGPRAVRRWLDERRGDDFDVFVERIPFEETRVYLKRVLASEAAYAYLYAPQALTEVLGLLPQSASASQRRGTSKAFNTPERARSRASGVRFLGAPPQGPGSSLRPGAQRSGRIRSSPILRGADDRARGGVARRVE
jgi:transglycosylase-like protein with SLT domain